MNHCYPKSLLLAQKFSEMVGLKSFGLYDITDWLSAVVSHWLVDGVPALTTQQAALLFDKMYVHDLDQDISSDMWDASQKVVITWACHFTHSFIKIESNCDCLLCS